MTKRKLKMYKYTKEQLYTAYIVYDMTLDELANALECSKSSLKYRLKELGIKKLNTCCRDKDVQNKIIDLYVNQNVPVKEIASMYDVDQTTIYFWLIKMGVKKPREYISKE